MKKDPNSNVMTSPKQTTKIMISNIESAKKALKKTKTFEVIFEERETFKVIVEAQDEQEASDLANEEFSNGNSTSLDINVQEIDCKEI